MGTLVAIYSMSPDFAAPWLAPKCRVCAKIRTSQAPHVIERYGAEVTIASSTSRKMSLTA